MDKNVFIRAMSNVDTREMLYNFFLESCGVDITKGIPSPMQPQTEYKQGLIKPAIDFINFMMYNNYEAYRLIVRDVKSRENIDGHKDS